jgi:peptide/nickel transport system substrate-binding protein
MSRWMRVVLVVFGGLLVATCGSPPSTEPRAAVAEPSPSSTEPRYGGNLVLGTPGEPLIFNMLYMGDVPSWMTTTLISDGLVEVNEKLELEPRIAAGPPEISADGTVWTYRLRTDVLFHDGMPLTAHDVAFTYGLFIHPDFTGPRASWFRSLARVDAVDDYTVQFTLSEPDVRFGTFVTFGILPRHLLGHIPVAELPDYRAYNVDHPIGAGPFKFSSWSRGQNLVLEAFDDYYRGRPYVDRVTFRFVSNGSAAVLLLETGEVHHALVPLSEVATVERLPNVALSGALQLNYEYIGWNLRNPLFTDRRVRQALTHAIDRQAIVDTVLEGHAEVAHSPASPLFTWAYTDDVPKFPYDPERAKALLAEAGWTAGPDGILRQDGKPFSFELLSNEGTATRSDVGAIVQQYLRAVGIDVRLVQLEWGTFLNRTDEPPWDYDAFVVGQTLDVDPDPSLNWHSRSIDLGGNDVGFRDPRVDDLLDRSVRLLDRDARAATLREVWRILAEEQPYTFLYYPQQFAALRSDVRGFVHHPQRPTYGMSQWWLDR